jgi:TonB family protein
MTLQQELALLQRDRQEERSSASQTTTAAKQQALEEHFVQLGKRLLRPSFDAPGVYERGPERVGEGYSPGEGGKYRSISSYGLKHVSYLLGLQRKIELVFSIPSVVPVGGVPVVGFTVRRDGALAEAVLLHSSGSPTVDQALLNAVKRAAPYHPFPDHLPDPAISIRVYVTNS